MHALRSASMLARLILAWFVLMLGVAVASPIVHPMTMEVLCSASAGGMKIGYTDVDGEPAQVSPHTLDCSLCLPVGAPVPMVSVALDMPQPLAHALTPFVAAHIAALVGAPLPPRGPPATTSA